VTYEIFQYLKLSHNEMRCSHVYRPVVRSRSTRESQSPGGVPVGVSRLPTRREKSVNPGKSVTRGGRPLSKRADGVSRSPTRREKSVHSGGDNKK